MLLSIYERKAAFPASRRRCALLRTTTLRKRQPRTPAAAATGSIRGARAVKPDHEHHGSGDRPIVADDEIIPEPSEASEPLHAGATNEESATQTGDEHERHHDHEPIGTTSF